MDRRFLEKKKKGKRKKDKKQKQKNGNSRVAYVATHGPARFFWAL